MPINYQPTTWVNNQDPPISAENLNHIEQGIKATADRVDELVTVEANPSDTPTATMESLEVDGTIYKVGGGHAVKDSGGNTMTQRENLQFTDAHTSDDSQGNTTKVEIAKQVTSQEWGNATEKGFYLIGDDDDYLLDISQVANADAEHLPYSSTQSTKQKIDALYDKDRKVIFGGNYMAEAQSSGRIKITQPFNNYQGFTSVSLNTSIVYAGLYGTRSSVGVNVTVYSVVIRDNAYVEIVFDLPSGYSLSTYTDLAKGFLLEIPQIVATLS